MNLTETLICSVMLLCVIPSSLPSEASPPRLNSDNIASLNAESQSSKRIKQSILKAQSELKKESLVSSAKYFSEALTESKKFGFMEMSAEAAAGLAKIYLKQEKAAKAIQLCDAEISYIKSKNSSKGLLTVLLSSTSAHLQARQYKEAESKVEEAIVVAKDAGELLLAQFAKMRLLQETQRWTDLEACIQRTLSLVDRTSIESGDITGSLRLGLAGAQAHKGDNKNAEEQYLQAIKDFESTGNKLEGLAKAYYSLAEFLNKQRRYQEASKFYTKADSLYRLKYSRSAFYEKFKEGYARFHKKHGSLFYGADDTRTNTKL